MKTQELRIGNYLELQEIIFKVISIDGRDNSIIAESINKECPSIITEIPKPIPLTEEWLLKFGFHQQIGFIKFIGEKYTNSFEVAHNSLDKWYCYFRNFNKGEQDDFVLLRNDLKYVHQLQNLYFELTGKELTI